MPISVSCPSCAAKLQAPDQAAGRKTKCPKCGGVILIAAETLTPAAAPTAAAASKPAAAKPASAKPSVRVPLAQAVLPAEPSFPDLPPLSSELLTATPAAFGQSNPQYLPQAQPVPQRGGSLVLWIVLGVVGFMLFVGLVIAPIVLKNSNSSATANDNDADDPSDVKLALFDDVVQQAHAEYTIPDDEKKPPRPPAVLTPRESKLLYVLNGDRLGMTTEEFRTKYRHKLKGDSRPSPMMSDHRHRAARRDNPLETLSEQSWHVDANMVHARITWPFEDTANSSFTPSLGGVRALDHRFMFVDEQLWRMQFMFPSSEFAQVRQAVIAQLGQPGPTPSSLGIALRGSYPGVVLSWRNELAEVDLIERTLEGDKSFLLIRHLALEKVDESRRPPQPGATPMAQQTPAPAPPRAVPRTPPVVRKNVNDELNGDRLGMPLADFKKKYRRVSAVDGQIYPITSDTITAPMRERMDKSGTTDEPWQERAGVISAVVSSPLEAAQQSQHVPKIGNVLSYKHTYRFLDEKLYHIDYRFPRIAFPKVAQTLKEKYGSPGKAPERIENIFAKRYPGEILYWRNGNTEMFLVERTEDGEKSVLYFEDMPMHNEVAKRRAKILGK